MKELINLLAYVLKTKLILTRFEIDLLFIFKSRIYPWPIIFKISSNFLSILKANWQFSGQ